jgi:photosystem II stability/assembly factor-like uncharacterized protein
MNRRLIFALLATISLARPGLRADDKNPLAAISPRSLGPAMTGGRVLAFAVDPSDHARFFAAAASGGLWKTVNNGTSWEPVFDKESVFSIGAVVLDPRDPSVVWVGTGEANSTRSVSWGDGVYKSVNGGKEWNNVGLKDSERIGRIVIDPRNSDIVYVAALGSLWGPSRERGLYKTEDGGKSWKNILSISEHTGVADVSIDPAHPDTLYAAAYQRERRDYSFIGGGPESAIYKSTDAGKSWSKAMTGIPRRDLGRIGLAVSPADPRVVYATVEASEKKGGIFRSEDSGATWEKRNDLNPTPWYYSQIIPDPKEASKVYVVGEAMFVSSDGGKNFRRLAEKAKHGDTHTVWIDPENTRRLLAGCDGGVYQSYDSGETWNFFANLPLAQFYRVAYDLHRPHYFLYGGTQDNNTVGAPSSTDSVSGVTNSDWFVTTGGDGFFAQVDPEDSSTVYSEAQYGEISRFDTKSGSRIGIQPQPGRGEEALRWNWDAPILISPRDHRTVYFGANFLFRSRDRGDSWQKLGSDLTLRADRDKMKMMGRLWPRTAVARNEGIAFFGNITSISESPKTPGLLYVGTDDGLIQVSSDEGKSWQARDKFPGVPETTLVTRIVASRHGSDTVFALFDGHRNRDFAPHLLKSSDRGKNWISIGGDLPKDGPVAAFCEDPFNPDLLFAGTEFGAFWSRDGGLHWSKLPGLPTISVRDIAVQPQEHDLIVATFGRGIYIVDDISFLEMLPKDGLNARAALFAPLQARLFLPRHPRGGSPKGAQGEDFFAAPNPPYGATFTYFLKEDLKSERQKLAEEAEKVLAGKGSPGAMSAEKAVEILNPRTSRELKEEEAAKVSITIFDATGRAVRTLDGPAEAGFHRITWDLRLPPPYRVEPSFPGPSAESIAASRGPLVLPGPFSASLSLLHGSKTETLGVRQNFIVATDAEASLSREDRTELEAFLERVRQLDGAVYAAVETARRLEGDLDQVKKALSDTPLVTPELSAIAKGLQDRVGDVLHALAGDPARESLNPPPSIRDRADRIVDELRLAQAPPTRTERESLELASSLLGEELLRLSEIRDRAFPELNRSLDRAGAPWTPGRTADPPK